MRVLHVTDVYLPKLGGIEKQVAGLAKAQTLKGYEVHILTASIGNDADTSIHRLSSRKWFGLPLNFAAGAEIEDLVKRLQPAVVHLHTGVVSQFVWLTFFRLRGKFSMVATVHSVWGPLARAFYRGANRITGFAQDIVLSSVSAPAAKRVSDAVNQSVQICPNGVDLSHWELVSRQRVGPVKFVTATRLAARKRVLPLLLVLYRLKRKVGPNQFELKVAGSGIAQSLLQFWVRLLKLSEVEFVGRLNSVELQELYASSDLFIQLSTKEAFGLAAIEARATGLPVIGRAGSGFIEFITPGDDGQLLASDTAVTEYLTELIQQPTLLDAMQKHARIHPRHGWELALAEVDRLYENRPAPRS